MITIYYDLQNTIIFLSQIVELLRPKQFYFGRRSTFAVHSLYISVP